MLNSCALDGKVVNGKGSRSRVPLPPPLYDDTIDVECHFFRVEPGGCGRNRFPPVLKQPWERVSRTLDFSDALALGDALVRVTPTKPQVLITTDIPGLTVEATVPHGGYEDIGIRLWFQGGEDGQRYKVTLRAFTRGGERIERELRVVVREI